MILKVAKSTHNLEYLSEFHAKKRERSTEGS